MDKQQQSARKFLSLVGANESPVSILHRFVQEYAKQIYNANAPSITYTSDYVGWYNQMLARLEVVEGALQRWCAKNEISYTWLVQNIITHKVAVSGHIVVLADTQTAVPCIAFDFSPGDAGELAAIANARLQLEQCVRGGMFLRYTNFDKLIACGTLPDVRIVDAESIIRIYDAKAEIVLPHKLWGSLIKFLDGKVPTTHTRTRFFPPDILRKYRNLRIKQVQVRVATAPLWAACMAVKSDIHQRIDELVQFESV